MNLSITELIDSVCKKKELYQTYNSFNDDSSGSDESDDHFLNDTIFRGSI